MNKAKSAVSKLFGNKLFVLLMVCAVAVVVISAFTNSKRMEIAQRMEETQSVNIPALSGSDKKEGEQEKTETPAPEVVPTPSADRPADVVPPVVAAATLEFQLPLQGEMLQGFSGSELLWSETMQDWRTHDGLDIAAQDGADVYAAERGTVTSAAFSELYGNTIVLEHSSGIKTVYKNLAEMAVSEGQELEKGAVIGKVGNSGAFEVAEQPHLHFEMYKDGRAVDPLEQINASM